MGWIKKLLEKKFGIFVETNDGRRFRLLKTEMAEDTVYRGYAANRSDLASAFTSAARYPGTPYTNEIYGGFARIESHSEGLRIGCMEFGTEASRKIVNWANETNNN